MSSTWIDHGVAFRTEGHSQVVDPGTGSARYQKSLDLLTASNSEKALASFTFDPNAGGSVVVLPEQLRSVPVSSDKTRIEYEFDDDGVDRWKNGYVAMSKAILEGEVNKVVLARHCEVTAQENIDAAALANTLATLNPESFVYEIESLVGASPELLVRIADGRLTTRVLAGTSLVEEGLTGPKIAEEHSIAAISAIDSLRQHLEAWEVSESTTRQGRMVHAATLIEGELRNDTTIVDVLADLHPTAAVCGTPTTAAMDLIRRYEPPRGRYAGPVGWFDREGNGVFALALRCALVQGRRATVYAGGGLVAGSHIDDELAETELKLRPILDALS